MVQATSEGMRLSELEKRLDTLGDHYSLFVSVKPTLVQKGILTVAKNLVGKGIPGLFVSFNKPYLAVIEELKKKEVNTEHIFFVDCVSSTAGIEQRSDNVLFLNSPANLTGLSIGITQFIEAIPGNKFLLIDTLQTLSIYLDSNTIAAFVRSLSAKTSKYPLRVVTISTPTPINEKIIPFFDDAIEVEDV